MNYATQITGCCVLSYTETSPKLSINSKYNLSGELIKNDKSKTLFWSKKTIPECKKVLNTQNLFVENLKSYNKNMDFGPSIKIPIRNGLKKIYTSVVFKNIPKDYKGLFYHINRNTLFNKYITGHIFNTEDKETFERLGRECADRVFYLPVKEVVHQKTILTRFMDNGKVVWKDPSGRTVGFLLDSNRHTVKLFGE